MQLELLVEQTRELYPEGAEVMLTSTVHHVASDDVADTVDVLYKSRAALRLTTEWRALRREFGIAVDISSLDVAFGDRNGTHPHFHELLVFERLPLVTPRASMKAELHELIAQQDRRCRFKHGDFIDRWANVFADDENKRPPHGRTPKEIAEDPMTDRIELLIKLLDEMPAAFATAATIPFRDTSPAFQRNFLAGIKLRLTPAWARCAERFMLRSYGRKVTDRAVLDRQALDLTPADHAASYLVSWGLEKEITSTTSKGQSHLRLLDLLGSEWSTSTIPWQRNAVQVARQLYRDFIVAIRGRHWIVGLTAARKKFGITNELVEERSEQLREERLAAAKANGDSLATRIDYVIRRRHWPTACWHGLGPTITWINQTSDRLEASGYRTARQRAAAAAAMNAPAADRQLSFERLRAQGARPEPILDLEEALQKEVDRYLEDLTLAYYAWDRERYRARCRGTPS